MRKAFAIILTALVALGVLFPITGCAQNEYSYFKRLNGITLEISPSYEKKVEAIDGVVQLEVASVYTLTITFSSADYYGEIIWELGIAYDHSKIALNFEGSHGKTYQVTYQLYAYDLTPINKLIIEWRGKTNVIKYAVNDYDFEGRGYVTPTTFEEVDICPEFTEALNSITYHEFEEPYCGIEYYKYNENTNFGIWNYQLSSYNETESGYDTGYLKYLTDSIYYPAKFDFVKENVGTASIFMYFNNREQVAPNATRSVIRGFHISYSVIDPNHTNPKNPLLGFHYSASPLANEGYKLDKDDEKVYPSQREILHTKYPERYFKYEVGGVTAWIIIQQGKSISAWFKDEVYSYTLYASFN